MMRFLVTASKGLEEVVAAELGALGLDVLERSPGMVAFKGRREDGWRACLWLRAGRRVLLPLGSFQAPDAGALYDGARAMAWPDMVPPDRTFAVEATVKDSAFSHSGFVALKVKDAIADAVRDRCGSRPNVDRSDPQVSVVVHVAGEMCHVSLDLSGGPLHKRGYRMKSVAAPLNETLAAGILLLLGYDGSRAFADPFCGSGTLCIEAALLATRTAPGLLRNRPFGFERWPAFPAKAWREMRDGAREARRPAPAPVLGMDADARAVSSSKANAEAAGVVRWIRLERRRAEAFEPPRGGGLIACNPPYGEHVGTDQDLPALYRAFGDALKRRCAGWTAGLLTGSPELAKCVGLHPKRRIALFNGPMPCKLLVYELYEGSLKK